MLDRVKLRLEISDQTQDALLQELLQGAQDAICLYAEEVELPPVLQTTAVMLTVDCYNRLGSEGMTSETKGSLSQAFFTDLLLYLFTRVAIELISGKTPWLYMFKSGHKLCVNCFARSSYFVFQLGLCLACPLYRVQFISISGATSCNLKVTFPQAF